MPIIELANVRWLTTANDPRRIQRAFFRKTEILRRTEELRFHRDGLGQKRHFRTI
jgi:hypothetical protein